MNITPLALYLSRLNEPHNIDQHLSIIRYYAGLCQHVTEFGVERGWSTSAILASGAKTVRSYDIARWEEVDLLEEAAREGEIDFKFILGDSRRVVIDETDLLFVDTDHTYDQVDIELDRHIKKVRRFLVFHDIVSCPVIVAAIRRHCPDHLWCIREWSIQQNGLAVLERIPA